MSDKQQENTETEQFLAHLCEDGMLKRPHVSDDKQKISYTATDDLKQRLHKIVSSQEVWDKSTESEKALISKLAALFKKEQQP